jgi:prepilin-type N-terminal cleavage/methylation domain-containing protein
MNKHKSQSGRSMIEMLGVLAIVGILSVGALSGYSIAMTNYKATQAIDEFNRMIYVVRDLYANKHYSGIIHRQVCNAGLWDNCDNASVALNIFGNRFDISPAGGDPSSMMSISYNLMSIDSSMATKMCKKILLSGMDVEYGNDLNRIAIRRVGPTFHTLSWTLAAPNTLPVSIETANTVCEDVEYVLFWIK